MMVNLLFLNSMRYDTRDIKLIRSAAIPIPHNRHVTTGHFDLK